MSVPGMRGWVRRPVNVTVEGMDQHGNTRRATFSGAISRLVQHEAAHLYGHLFPGDAVGQRWLVPTASFTRQKEWVHDWPSPGAYRTRPGEFSELL